MSSETSYDDKDEGVIRVRPDPATMSPSGQRPEVAGTPLFMDPLTSPILYPQESKIDNPNGSPLQTTAPPITVTPITSPPLKDSIWSGSGSGSVTQSPKKKIDSLYEEVIVTIFSCIRKAGQVVK